jgi:hypothetical protein
MSYGSVSGVASLAKAYTTDNYFWNEDCLSCLVDRETNPTRDEVTSWLSQISNTLNVVLAGEGFTVPITETKCVSMLDMMVNQWVADLVQAANMSGRFFTERAQQFGAVPMMVIRKEIRAWANENAGALEAAGATRGTTATDEIATKDSTPIFAREGFSNTFEDWETLADED